MTYFKIEFPGRFLQQIKGMDLLKMTLGFTSMRKMKVRSQILG